MRFSTIAAFMLPLTALAAPVSELVRKNSGSVSNNAAQLDQLRQQIFEDIGTLNSSLTAMFENGKKIQEGSNKAIVNDIVVTANQDLNDRFVILFDRGAKIIGKILAGQPPDQNEYVATP